MTYEIRNTENSVFLEVLNFNVLRLSVTRFEWMRSKSLGLPPFQPRNQSRGQRPERASDDSPHRRRNCRLQSGENPTRPRDSTSVKLTYDDKLSWVGMITSQKLEASVPLQFLVRDDRPDHGDLLW
jgi:hypothetical protein